ncbi:MAG: hypothetical protein A3H96_04650 [Acidobacteria bacterium RIFCSPLOWO2_02_FULL_67_36]|nr:MAG: hypothetical protein A3H96_04650 [Acidobacteria bacterium RIFCSPLOWO2_02_FULL_67_36]
MRILLTPVHVQHRRTMNQDVWIGITQGRHDECGVAKVTAYDRELPIAPPGLSIDARDSVYS